MKALLLTVLVTSVKLKCFGEVDAYRVYLKPSPTVKVKEGDALTLCCSCSGPNNPDYINWYLNNDTLGLVIETSSCKYQTRLGQYEIDRYTIACNDTQFYLSITSISKDKDDQDTWECDTTVIGMQPPLKASTRIDVIGADLYADDTTFSDIQNTKHGPGLTSNQKESNENLAGKNGQFDEPKTVVVAGIVGGVISAFVVVIIAAAGYFHYRKRRNDHLKNKINKDHAEDHDEDHVEDHVEDEQMRECLEIRT